MEKVGRAASEFSTLTRHSACGFGCHIVSTEPGLVQKRASTYFRRMDIEIRVKADGLLAELREFRRQRNEWPAADSPASELRRLNALIKDREGQLEALGVDHV